MTSPSPPATVTMRSPERDVVELVVVDHGIEFVVTLTPDQVRLLAEQSVRAVTREPTMVPLKAAMANPRSKAEHERIRRGIASRRVRARKDGNRIFVNSEDVALLEAAYQAMRRRPL